MQKLILPIPNTVITAGFKNAAYRSKFGFTHYGHDFISALNDRKVWASGNGTVLATGADGVLGNVLIVLYPQTYNIKTAHADDLVLRYYHLASVSVKVGDAVTPAVQLGIYGNTGKYSAGAHLHVEVDYDTKHFAYSATIARDSTIIKAGNDLTMRAPSEILHLRCSPQQSCIASVGSFGGVPYVLPQDVPCFTT